VSLAAVTTWTSAVALLAGDAATAERDLRQALDRLNEVGEHGNLASLTSQLAEALVAQERYDEAYALVTSAEQAAPDDVHAQIVARVASAKAAGGIGRVDEAVASAREAVALAEETDSPVLAGDALLGLAAVLAAAGEWEDATAAADEASALYDAKGHLPAGVAARALSERQAAARTASTTA